MSDFEKDLAELFGDDIIDISDSDDIFSMHDFPLARRVEGGIKNTLAVESDITQGIRTSVDLVLCIDVTFSMDPIIDLVKGMAMSLYSDIVDALAQKRRTVDNFRVKVISFRDYYCDIDLAMKESRFFVLPDETDEFYTHLLNLQADGGGDDPENALEAIALAMKSDWVQAKSSNERARNIIVVFTDNSAHDLKKSQLGKPACYPADMLATLEDLKLAWEGADRPGGVSLTDIYKMDEQAKRMIIYSPLDLYPWNEITTLTNVKTSSIERAKGGGELDRQILLDYIAGSIK